MIGYYSGIGSRTTPPQICIAMTEFAQWAERKGLVLRSGGAIGADAAFEGGVSMDEHKNIYRSWHATKDAIEFASEYHPAWHRCSQNAKALHGRNAMIILGEDLRTPAEFVVCWSKDENRGGTAMGLSIARSKGIPVYNIFDYMDINHLYEDIEKLLAG